MSLPSSSTVRLALALVLTPLVAVAQSSMTLYEYPGRWEGNKARMCEGGTLVELPRATSENFTYERDPGVYTLDDGRGHWRTAPVTVQVPPGGYFETAYLRGALEGASKKNSLAVRVLVIDGDTGSATFGSKLMNASKSSGLYRVMEAQRTYLNSTDHTVTAVVVVGNYEEDWGRPVDGGGAIVFGQKLSDYIQDQPGDTATSNLGDVLFTAVPAGEAGNAVKIVLVGDATGALTTSVSGSVLTVHYKRGVTTVGDAVTAINALTGSDRVVTADIGPQDPTVVLSTVLVDPATITLAGGSSGIAKVNGNVDAGVCLRAITQPTDAEQDATTCQAIVDTASVNYAPAEVGPVVNSLGARVDALEAKPGCECGLERTGGGITSGCAANGVDASSLLALVGVFGALRLSRRRRASH